MCALSGLRTHDFSFHPAVTAIYTDLQFRGIGFCYVEYLRDIKM
jgi:hypothetical protein